ERAEHVERVAQRQIERRGAEALAAAAQGDTAQLKGSLRRAKAGEEEKTDRLTALEEDHVRLAGVGDRLPVPLERPLRDPRCDVGISLDREHCLQVLLDGLTELQGHARRLAQGERPPGRVPFRVHITSIIERAKGLEPTTRPPPAPAPPAPAPNRGSARI